MTHYDKEREEHSSLDVITTKGARPMSKFIPKVGDKVTFPGGDK